jgi:uncharacterized SAM-binding protein YcdF (DUF218 family)
MLIALGLWLLWRQSRAGGAGRARTWGLWMALGGCVALYLFSTPLVATWLAQSLEAQAPAVKIEDLPQADAIVVLAGDQTVYVRADGGVDMFNRCGDRMERGIQAFLANKAPVLALGDGINPVPNAPEFAEWQSDYAAKRGVPAAKIVRGRPARYTQDESEGVMEVLRPLGVKRIILATSAYHMMRARGVYHAHGVEVIALPCDFQSRGTAEHFSLKMLLPRGIALSQSETCLKEWLGTLVLWITGKGG